MNTAAAANSIGWARLTLELENVRNTHGREHPLFVMRAVLLSAIGLEGSAIEMPDGWTFRPCHPLGARVRLGAKYRLQVVVPPCAEPLQVAARLGQNVSAWLGGDERRNFRVAADPASESRTVEGISRTFPWEHEGNSGEWAMDFITPLLLRQGTDGRLNAERLAGLLESRLSPLGFADWIGPARALLTGEGAVEVRSWYMERVRLGHSQKHGPERKNSREDLGGLMGPLFLRGPRTALDSLSTVLCLAEEFHLGKGLHRGQGGFRLEADRGYFDARVGSHTVYFPAFDAVQAESEADPVLHRSGGTQTVASGIHSLHDRESWCRALAEEIRAGTYRPAAPKMIAIQKSGGGTRTLSLLEDRDRVAQRALHEVLSPVIDRELECVSHAWRAGRGIETARKLVADAFRDGLTWVVESDVAAFFDEIPHDGLDAALERFLPMADKVTLAALRSCYRGTEDEVPGARGILQGSPLSPLLANLYLDSFDEAVIALGYRMVRYGDDFLILCASREEAGRALEDVRTILARLDLRLKEEKTALTSFHAGFLFLGREFGSGMDEEAAEAATLRRTLFIHTQGAWAGVDHDSIVVRKEKELLARAPMERISDVVFLGAQGVSTLMLQRCARRRIPVTIATAHGWHVQTMVPDSRTHWELAARQAARHASLGQAGLTAQAREVLAAKLGNHSAWLAGLPRTSDTEAARAALLDLLKDSMSRLAEAKSVDTLRGIEGHAAAALFPFVNSYAINPEFHAPRRRPREKPDKWNALYDATSSLLFSRLNLLLRSRGVNPYLGFLHSAADPYESLVCDLQEPFRARLDRFLLKLVNRRVITPEHFTSSSAKPQPEEDRAMQSGGQVQWRLTHEGYRRLVDAWDRELRVRLAGDPGTLGDLLASQVWLTCEYIQKHLPFLKFYRAASVDGEQIPDLVETEET
jgi:CRISPR-associated endonuclease Cas1